MKKVIIIALLFLSYCSSPQSSRYFELPILKRIAQLSSIEPPPAVISFTPVFVVGISDSISEINFIRLQEVYKSLYAHIYPEFSDFLFDALNQKIKMDTKNSKTYLYYSQTFANDPYISRLYKEKGVNGLVETYCADNNGFYALKRGTLTLNEINSISYYLFLNQYIRVDDDYEATLNFKKLSSVIN
jgi:hypothetical protein